MIYVVTAHRWGNREDHGYVVGAFSVPKEAKAGAKKEEGDRGGKYRCLITEIEFAKTYIGDARPDGWEEYWACAEDDKQWDNRNRGGKTEKEQDSIPCPYCGGKGRLKV